MAMLMRLPRRSIPVSVLVLAASVAVVADCGLFARLDDAECPPEGTTLTWDNFAKKYFTAHCNTCHGAAVIDRQSAPPAYVFETPEQIDKWAERIFVRAAGPNDSMPPGPDDPPREERDKLAECLACECQHLPPPPP
jgi:uncharacterized membrane protein